MRIPRIYTRSDLQTPETFLDDNAAHHVGKVLRMGAGQDLLLFNGDGHEYAATIVDAGKKHVQVRVNHSQACETESPLRTIIGQVISRGERMDYMIQKAVELGVNEIFPLTSERCEVKLKGDREEKRLTHWQQIAISAAEQCGRATITTIHPIQDFSSWIQQPFDGHSLVLHHRSQQSLTDLPTPQQVRLVIGPEGGLSETEIQAASDTGFIETTLGPRVFRTETAPIAVLSTLQWLWGDHQGFKS